MTQYGQYTMSVIKMIPTEQEKKEKEEQQKKRLIRQMAGIAAKFNSASFSSSPLISEKYWADIEAKFPLDEEFWREMKKIRKKKK